MSPGERRTLRLSPDPDRSPGERVDAGQLAFVGLALVALVVPAFLAPTVAVPGDGDASVPVEEDPFQFDEEDREAVAAEGGDGVVPANVEDGAETASVGGPSAGGNGRGETPPGSDRR